MEKRIQWINNHARAANEVGRILKSNNWLTPTIRLYYLTHANEQHLSNNLKVCTFKPEENDISAFKAFSITPDQYWNERKN
jgi:hypothetical protein